MAALRPIADGHPLAERVAGDGWAAVDSVTRLEARLVEAGLGVSLRRVGNRFFSGGPNLVLGPECEADEWTRRSLLASTAAGVPASLHLPLSNSADADRVAADLAGILAGCGAPVQLSLLRLGGAPARRLRMRLASVQAPARGYLFLDPACDASLPDRIPARSWQTLRDSLSVPGPWLPAMHAGVRSRCPLLAAENSVTLLPGTAIAAPVQSAWLPLVLDLSRHSASGGRIDRGSLGKALDAAVDFGNRLFDCLSWCSPAQAEDARLNRRIAVCVVGIGELVVARRADPSSLACLRDLDRLLGEIHDGLWCRSRRLASRDGPLPALTERQPSARWRDESHRQDWARRWREAVEKVQVRNRNLLVLSPYSVLPRRARPDAAFADLVPLLAHADALSFAAPRLCVDWQDADFKCFYARLRAQVDRLNAASFVAAGA